MFKKGISKGIHFRNIPPFNLSIPYSYALLPWFFSQYSHRERERKIGSPEKEELQKLFFPFLLSIFGRDFRFIWKNIERFSCSLWNSFHAHYLRNVYIYMFRVVTWVAEKRSIEVWEDEKKRKNQYIWSQYSTKHRCIVVKFDDEKYSGCFLMYF